MKESEKFENDPFVKISERIWSEFSFLEGIRIPRQGQSGGTIDVDFAFQEPKDRKAKNRYYSQTEDKTYLHFTSKAACISILHERALRLYNLLNSNDSGEYSFTAEMFDGHLKHEIDWIKQYSFILSLTDRSQLTNEYHWNNYGANKDGVAIELKFNNHETDWDAFHLSPVYYGELDRKQEWLEKIQAIAEDYQPYNIVYDPSVPFMFQKNTHWSDEKEIRLGTAFPFCTYKNGTQNSWHDYVTSRDYHSTLMNSRIRFLPIHLHVREFLDKRDYVPEGQFVKNPPRFPEIEIVNIWIHHDGQNHAAFQGMATELSRTRLGYPIHPTIINL
jgi:hypothetical protein